MTDTKEWNAAPQSNVQCGVIAYNHLAEMLGQPGMLHLCSVGEDDPYKDPNEDEADFILHGMSALVLKNRSEKAGWPLRVIKRLSGESVPFPSIAHFFWGTGSGHFSAFMSGDAQFVEIKDTFLGLNHGVPVSVINPQLSGYFLIPASVLVPAGFAEVTPTEAAFVYGRGDDGSTEQSTEGTNPKECKTCSNGMAVHNFTTYLPGLVVEDTPLTYTPQYGPVPNLTLEYRQIDPLNNFPEDDPTQMTNIGPLWHFNEISYLRASNGSSLPLLNATGVIAQPMRWVDGDGSYYDYTISGAIPANVASRYVKSRPGLFVLYNTVASVKYFAGYKLVFNDGSQMEFIQPDKVSPPGMPSVAKRFYLSKRRDPQGQSLQYLYGLTPTDNKARLEKIELATQQSANPATPTPAVPGIVFEYATAADFKISKIYDPFGRWAELGYDGAGNLASIKDTVGIISSFIYENNNPVYLKSYTTPYGTHQVSWGHMIRPGQLPPVESAVVHISGPNTYYVAVTDPNGNEERLAREDRARDWTSWKDLPRPGGVTLTSKIPSSSTFKVDNVGFGFTTFRWTKKYWGEYLKAKSINPAADPYDYARSTAWMKDGSQGTNVPTMTKEPSTSPQWWNTGTTSLGTYTLSSGSDDQTTKLVRKVEDRNGTAQWTMVEQSYNTLGLPDITVDEMGRQIKRVYTTAVAGSTPDLLSVGVWDGAWKALVTYAGYVNHQPRSITYASGLRYDVTINNVEQPTAIKISHDVNATATTTTNRIRATYHSSIDGAVPAWTSGALVTDSNRGLLRRLETATVPTGTTVAAQEWTITDEFTYDAAERVRTHTDSTGYTLTFDYDNLDRVSLITHPDATTEQFSYQRGLGVTTVKALDLTAYKDRDGRWTRMAYNSVRQPELQLTPDGKSIQYAWCKCGSLWKLTDALGRVTEWKRDIMGRVTEKIRAQTSVKTTYTYEPLSGRLKTVTPPDRASVTYRYNVDGSLYQEDYDDAGLTPDVTYHFTTVAGGTTQDPLGRLRFVQDGIGTHTMTYKTAAGAGLWQLLSIDGPLGNDDQVFTFDNQDRVSDRDVRTDLAAVTRSETYTWDGLGRLKTVLNTLGTFTQGYTTNLSRLDSIAAPNSITSALTYWPANASFGFDLNNQVPQKEGSLWGITHSRSVAPATQYSKHTYGYDLSGRLTNWIEEASGVPNPTYASFEYNSSDELTGQANRYSPTGSVFEQRQWNYDAAGNWLSTGDGTTLSMRTHDLSLNRLTRIGGAGRMMLEGHVNEFATVTVNIQGPQSKQAVLMSDPAGGYNFHVEVDLNQGNNVITLIAQDQDGQQTTRQYSYSAAGLSRGFSNQYTYLSSDFNASYATVRQFEYDAKNRLKTVTVSGTTWEAGTLGSVVARYDYSAYQKPVKVSGTTVNASLLINSRYYHHEASGLELALYRAYDPELGRWISEDPLGEDGGLNLYGYVGNNPLMGTDPLGLYINVYGPTAQDRSNILNALKGWVRGNLTLKDGAKNLRWDLQRESCPEDGDIESQIDELIKSDKPYTITMMPNDIFGTAGGRFIPANGGGGTIQIEPQQYWGTYQSASGPATPNLGMILAHELLGRAKVDLEGGKHNNADAVNRSNPA
ncbi:MAG: RHS repeat-associated core domain-containing protein, partial [Prosthecobacter sp.]